MLAITAQRDSPMARVNWLINHSELRVRFQPTLSFATFMDDVVIDDEYDRFSAAVACLKVLKQIDKQHQTFAIATNVADFPRSGVQRSGQIVFFIPPRSHLAFLQPAHLPVCPDFWVEVDTHTLCYDRQIITHAVEHALNIGDGSR